MYEDFVRDRITQLRLKKGISEYQMSYDLGHSLFPLMHIDSSLSSTEVVSVVQGSN